MDLLGIGREVSDCPERGCGIKFHIEASNPLTSMEVDV